MVGDVRAAHRRVPVMRMHDLGLPLQVGIAGGQVRGHPAEQRETLQVVRPFLAVLSW